MKHLYTLDTIGKENQGNRYVGSKGHQDTLDYIQQIIEKTNQFDIQRQEVKVEDKSILAASLKLFDVQDKTQEFKVVQFKNSPNTHKGGILTKIINQHGTGCTSSNEEGEEKQLDKNKNKEPWIALVKRGECTFTEKQLNAYHLGASAVLIYNNLEGDYVGELNVTDAYIPVGGISKETGETLIDLLSSNNNNNTYQLKLESKTVIHTSYNIIADTKAGNKSNTIVIGAHSDSVKDGPGINDDGSGISTLLELAVHLNQQKINNAIRFCWWTAEELGLIGSQYYVNSLTQQQLNDIALYLNIDMIASPNYVNYIYDGDGSDSPKAKPAPTGSDDIERTFENYFKSQKQGFQPLDLDLNARTDSGPFYAAGIPFGGLTSGFDYNKTEEEVKLYGGTVGVAHDPCYHKICDTIDNVNSTVFLLHARAYAHALSIYSKSTTSLYAKGH
ncbi:hypothetical protein BJ944DRAFT_239784 [Cunninghamella echinulata]|nr:hypothetical protein BJ944DRAFT_239784 [Cunninghamella echinulata]